MRASYFLQELIPIVKGDKSEYSRVGSLNPMYTGRLFHCYILDESIYHFRDVMSISDGKILLANNKDPDQMPHYMASDLGLHCLAVTLLRVSR